MTAMVSMRATTTNPIVPANESNILSQYSPAPVVKISPIEKQNTQTTPEDQKVVKPRSSNKSFKTYPSRTVSESA